MNLVQYQMLSRRTMPFSGYPTNNIEFRSMLGNYSMGLIGEVVELIEVYRNNLADANVFRDMIKELGDIAHYTVGLYAMHGQPMPLTFIKERFTVGESLEAMLYAAKEISEYSKKHIYHMHDRKEALEGLGLILSCINHIAYKIHQDLSIVLETNVNKLKTRYENGFTTSASVERKDVAESTYEFYNCN